MVFGGRCSVIGVRRAKCFDDSLFSRKEEEKASAK